MDTQKLVLPVEPASTLNAELLELSIYEERQLVKLHATIIALKGLLRESRALIPDTHKRQTADAKRIHDFRADVSDILDLR